MLKRNGILFLLFVLAIFFNHPTHGAPSHGYSVFGRLKYPKDFKALDYVNPRAPKGGTLALSSLGSFDNLNPFIIRGSAAAGMTYLYPSLAHATLMFDTKDEVGSAYCYLAQSIDVSPEFDRVTFEMRPDATFSDGKPITVHDVAFSFEILREKGLPLFKAYYHDVASVKIIGPKHIAFIFSQPNRELPLLLGQMPILCKTFYKDRDFEKGDLDPPIVSGPYVIKDVDAGSFIAYERRKDFWGQDLPILQGLYNFHTITYRYFLDDTVRFEDFKAGNHDVRLENISKNWVKGYDIKAIKTKDIEKKTFAFKNPKPFQGFAMNLRRPLFKDRRVRQALGLLFDFEYANRVFFYQSYERLHSYFQGSALQAKDLPSQEELIYLEPHRDALPPEVFTKVFDPPKGNGRALSRDRIRSALALLKEAGYVIKKGTLVHEKTGVPFRFEFLTTGTASNKIIEFYGESLRKVGIKMTQRAVDASNYERMVENHDFDMIMIVLAQSPMPGNEQRDFWLSSRAAQKGSRNYGGISNPVVDQIVEQLIDAPSREKQIDLARCLDRILLWHHYMVPLYTSKDTRLAHWKHIGMPDITPDYGMESDAWWSIPKQASQSLGS